MIDLAAQIGLKRPQAVLLVGGKDTGKFEMARKIAALYIQEQYPHPDIIVYEPSRKTPKGRPILSIDEVRDIVNRATMPPMFASDIVVVIRDIHLATIPASNAILKVLEEPGATTK
ncbi:MAG: hypothetical protein OEX12_06100, partial [Gammaproteobacteria bacterium]|nr:hypothetical protein [Gammaproteobacteria bacterium]